MKFLCPTCYFMSDAEPQLRKEGKPIEWEPYMGYWMRIAYELNHWNYYVECTICGAMNTYYKEVI